MEHQVNEWADRELPVYDQSRLADEELPDGVRTRELPTANNSVTVGNGITPTVLQQPTSPKVEGFEHTNLNRYGYPNPTPYATMGYSNSSYNTQPGPQGLWQDPRTFEFFQLPRNTHAHSVSWIVGLAALSFVFILVIVATKK